MGKLKYSVGAVVVILIAILATWSANNDARVTAAPAATAPSATAGVPIFASVAQPLSLKTTETPKSPAGDLLALYNKARSIRAFAYEAKKFPEKGGRYYAIRALFECAKISRLPAPKEQQEQQIKAMENLAALCDISAQERNAFINEMNAERRTESSADPLVDTAMGALARANTLAERRRVIERLIELGDPLTIIAVQYVDTETPGNSGESQDSYFFNGRWYRGDERELLDFAWPLATCDLGLNCGPDSILTLKLCVQRGWCATTYADSVQSGFSGAKHAQWQQILVLKNELVTAIRQKRIAAFMPPTYPYSEIE